MKNFKSNADMFEHHKEVLRTTDLKTDSVYIGFCAHGYRTHVKLSNGTIFRACRACWQQEQWEELGNKKREVPCNQ